MQGRCLLEFTELPTTVEPVNSCENMAAVKYSSLHIFKLAPELKEMLTEITSLMQCLSQEQTTLCVTVSALFSRSHRRNFTERLRNRLFSPPLELMKTCHTLIISNY